MRCIIKAVMPHDAANAMITEGRLGETMKGILEPLKPETALFYAEDGCRCVLIVADIADPSRIPAIAEPLFLALNAKVTISPAMNVEDLMKATPDIEAAVKRWSRQPAIAR